MLIGGYDAPVHIVETRQVQQHICQSHRVHIPANTSATLVLPDGSRRELGSGHYAFTVAVE